MNAATLFATAARRAHQEQLLAEAARGRAFARAWRHRMKPFFDAIYGPERVSPFHLRTAREEAERGRQLAAKWRTERPYGPLLDSLYGKEVAR